MEKPRFQFWNLISPGKLKATFWTGSGPIGKGFLRRLIELAAVSECPTLVGHLDTLVSEFNRVTGLSPSSSRIISIPSQFLD